MYFVVVDEACVHPPFGVGGVSQIDETGFEVHG